MKLPSMAVAKSASKLESSGATVFRVLNVLLTFVLAGGIFQGCTTIAPEPEKKIEQAPKPAVVAADPITPQIQADFEVAMALLKAEQYEKSIEAFTRVAAALPDNVVPLVNLALAHKKLGKSDAAEAQFKRALEIEPEHPVASNELALLYRQKGRFAEAKPVYERTLKKYPNFSMAHKNLGVLCDLYLRDYDCALTHYKLYSAIVPDDKNVKIWIADLQKRTGK